MPRIRIKSVSIQVPPRYAAWQVEVLLFGDEIAKGNHKVSSVALGEMREALDKLTDLS